MILAFAAIYLIWGSTFLAIRYAVETIPPFLMAGTRVLAAGLILLVLTRRSWSGVRPVHWRSAAFTGGAMFLGGHGLLCWAEQHVPSGIAALVEASIPIWIVVLRTAPRRRMPDRLTIGGVTIGFLGVAILVLSRPLTGHVTEPIAAYAALLLSAISWSVGSLYTRSAPLPNSIGVSTGMQLVAGGVLLMLAGSATGEWGRLHVPHVSGLSVLSLFYLILLGSLVTFSAYGWLLRHTDPAIVGTYAFVNPLVAVALGRLIGGEPVCAAALAGGTLIIGAAVLMHFAPRVRREPRATR